MTASAKDGLSLRNRPAEKQLAVSSLQFTGGVDSTLSYVHWICHDSNETEQRLGVKNSEVKRDVQRRSGTHTAILGTAELGSVRHKPGVARGEKPGSCVPTAPPCPFCTCAPHGQP